MCIRDSHKLEGDITFTDVDFGYVPEKTVLHADEVVLHGLGFAGGGAEHLLSLIHI